MTISPTPIELLRKSEVAAALDGVRRIRRMLKNDSTSSGDVIKATSLLLDRVQDAPEMQSGDFVVTLSDSPVQNAEPAPPCE